MSLENDPFDTQPAPPPPPLAEEAAPYAAPYEAGGPPPPRTPIAVWIGLGILAFALLIALGLLVIVLGQGGAAPVTPTATAGAPQPTVLASPQVVSGGILVTLQGLNYRPNDRVVFFLRDPAKPTEPILQIGTTDVSAVGSFVWTFSYPNDARWTSISSASVIVQSTATGAYQTVNLTVVPGTAAPTIVVPTLEPPTPGPQPTAVPPQPTFTPVPFPTATQTPDPNMWRGEYYNNPNLQGAPVLVRNDPSINFNWGTGSPAPNIPVDYFSARWTRSLMFDGGMYRFSAQADDGVRVWLDSQLLIDHWTTASPNVLTRDVNVPAGSHVVRVEYFEGVGLAFINFNIDRITSFPDWRGDYFNNQFLSGAPAFSRNDVAVSFDWGSASPAPGVPPANFSVRWTRTVNFAAGSYRFTTRVTGGVALFIDGNLIINQWAQNNNATFSVDQTLTSGTHTFEVRYFSAATPASIWFTYQPLTGSSSDWTGNYFANNQWSGVPTMVRFDPNVDFNWGEGSPAPLLPVDNFSARWTRVMAVAQGDYRFDFTVDDGVRFFVDGTLLINEVREQAVTKYSVQMTLAQGNHEFRIEYVEYAGQALISFVMTPLNVWNTPTPAPPTATFVPTPTNTPVVMPTNTPVILPTNTFTPIPTTPTVPPSPTINSFIAQPTTIQLGLQCVTLTWTTTGAQSPIWLDVNGQQLETNLPPSGMAQHCPTEAGQKVYTLTITASPYYGAVIATQNVQVISPTPTPTLPPTPQPK
jgi:hypothetical protein